MIGSRYLTDTPRTHAATVPGMAHFAGTGPAGKHCKDCVLWGRGGACQKFKEMMGHKGPSISGWQLSCRHFQQKETL
jgi:hypothetical protein